jgi:oxygen-independent coproporphyrinogen-3 oxidase
MTLLPDLPAELVRRLDVAAPRYTSYPTVPEWTDRVGPSDWKQVLEEAAAKHGPLSLYAHIPFCREMCSYCGCNVIVSRDPAKADRYLGAMKAEARQIADRLGGRRRLSRIHLGGGTPTFLSERQLLALWRLVTDEFVVQRDAELAVEIDPVVTRREQLALLRGLGFHRLSMGVQDFDADVQRAVGRIQTVDQTRAVLDYARELEYGSVNFDLIYGLPMQTPDSWRRTLAEVVTLRPDRISLFSFAFVPEVKPHQRRLPVARLPVGPAKLELFRLGHDMFREAGYRAVGMDHFSLPSDELAWAQEQHRLWRDFQGYTVERAPDTIGLGVSAISSIGSAYFQNVKSLSRYAAAVHEGWPPIERGFRLSPDDQRRRAVIIQLMCNFCVDLPGGAAYFAPELERLRDYERDGLLTLDGTRVALTPLGRVFVRNIASVFDIYLRARRDADRPVYSRTV